jgi:hypothetical protein
MSTYNGQALVIGISDNSDLARTSRMKVIGQDDPPL